MDSDLVSRATFKDYYFKEFNRFIDLNEISETLNDDFIKETTNVRKIF